MKLSRSLIFPLLLLLLLLAQGKCLAQHGIGNDYVIRKVNIISPEKKKPLLENRDVYIKDGRIVKIQKASKNLVGINKTIIDGMGKYLMAGLADMHAHIPADDQEKYLLMNLAAGVTTLRSMRGDTSHISLKREIAAGKQLGPDLILSAPAISARTSIQEHELPRAVLAYKQMGFDLIKVLSVPDSSYFEKLMAAARTSNMPVAGHSPRQIHVKRVVENGYSSIEHLQGVIDVYQSDSLSLAPLITRLKINKVYNCPTLDWYYISYKQFSLDELTKRKGLEYVDVQLVRQWVAQAETNLLEQSKGNQDSLKQKLNQDRKDIQDKLRLVKKLNESDAPLLLSPDASGAFAIPGFNVCEEMKLYSRAGISNQDILKIAVFNPAAYLGKQDDWGSIGVGKKANLIMLSENPLESIENIEHVEAVMSNGKYLEVADVISRLNKISNI
jgi:hypothetical protein